MLRIYGVILETVAEVRPVIERIEKKDGDLARQMRRAVASVALNTSEGMYSRGGNRQARYHSALGSARETLACIEVGAALGYVETPSTELRRRFDTIIGTLRKLVGHQMRLVTPGIRPAGGEAGDQKRIVTPKAAIAAGADYLVVGRPIVAAPEPRAVAEAIVAEIAQTAKETQHG